MSREGPSIVSAPKPLSLGSVIDSLEFAQHRGSLAATLGVASLSRLSDLLARQEGQIKIDLRGELDEEHQAWLVLSVVGELCLVCQRCLGAMDYALRFESRLRLVRPGEPWPEEDAEDDSADAIEASRELSVLSLVEDEILLALPLAPVHAVCELPGGRKHTGLPSSFAALEVLKKH